MVSLPGHAGVPILEVLKNLELHNVNSSGYSLFRWHQAWCWWSNQSFIAMRLLMPIEHVGVVRKVVQTELSLKVSYSAWGKTAELS